MHKQVSHSHIIITKHALERAKQRLNLGLDFNNDSLLFEVKIKDLFKKSTFTDADKTAYHFYGTYINQKTQLREKIKFVATYKDSNFVITTIIVK